MEIQQFRYYLQLCEDQSFVTASEHLYISQQALRKSIKKLEDELGVELVYRKGNRINLTPVGESVRSFAAIIMQELGAMDAAVKGYREDSEFIEVQAVMASGCYNDLALKVVEPFRAKYPHVNIRITEQPDMVCEQFVANGSADLAFCFGPNDPSLYNVVPLVREPLYALVNVNNRLASRDFVTLADLIGERIGIPDEHYKIHHSFIYACHAAGFKPDIAFKGRDPFSTHHYSHYTENLSITSGDYARSLAEDNQVVIPLKADGLANEINVITRKGASLSPTVEHLIEFSKQAFKK